MLDVSLHFAAVVVAALAYAVLGMLWYSPLLFGKRWAALTRDHRDRNGERAAALELAGALVTAYVLELVVSYARARSALQCAFIAFLLWLGLYATISANNHVFENRPLALYLVNAGFSLAGLLVMGVVISLWH